ncbi:MAG: CDP-alcohol phosphatidyltransferase family protein [Gammaproteobacteria bacterium]
MKPWDARLASLLIRPLRDTPITPNHLTTVRLLTGIAAAAAFASGVWPNLAAILFALSNLLDHTDGELARLTGKGSRAGHIYDLISDAIVHILLFLSIGIGLWISGSGVWTLPAGIIAGLAVTAIFHIRSGIEERYGKTETKQPGWGGFEAEDVLYLLPLVTLLEGLVPFLAAAAIGAPIAAGLVVRQLLALQRAPSQAQ